MMRRGFTLIELLVVISILVLLIGLLIPAMNNVHQQARAVACQSNIHQLQLGFQSYENQNQTLPYGFQALRSPGPFPGFPNRYTGTATTDIPGWFWLDLMNLRIKQTSGGRQPGMYQCPSKYLDDPVLDWDNLCGNYGVNRAICTSSSDLGPFATAYQRPPVSTSTLRQPGSTILVLDSGYALICWWQATSKPPVTLTSLAVDTAYVPGLDINKDRLLKPGQTDDAINGRHPNKTVNVGFADGHAERKKAQELLVEKVDKDNYANKTPLWEPR